jgi:hypothetical protein
MTADPSLAVLITVLRSIKEATESDRPRLVIGMGTVAYCELNILSYPDRWEIVCMEKGDSWLVRRFPRTHKIDHIDLPLIREILEDLWKRCMAVEGHIALELREG